MFFENTIIKTANIAVSSKDLSKLKLKNISIDKCNYAYAVFQKKIEYGSSEISVEKFNRFSNW